MEEALLPENDAGIYRQHTNATHPIPSAARSTITINLSVTSA